MFTQDFLSCLEMFWSNEETMLSLCFVTTYFMNWSLRLHITAIKNHKTLQKNSSDFFFLFFAVVTVMKNVKIDKHWYSIYGFIQLLKDP